MSEPHQDMARDLAAAAAKTVPPVTVWALTLNEWLALASIIYVIAQLAHLAWRWRREAKRRDA